MADNRRPALPLAAVPKLAQPLVLSYQLLQHTHFAQYVNFKFSNLIPLKKVNIQKLIWQCNHLMSKQLPLSRYQHQMTGIDIDKA